MAASAERRGGVALSGRGGVALSAPAYPHEVLAAVFQVHDARLRVLLRRRDRKPDEGRWALPGGALGERDRLGTAVARHLAESVDITHVAHLEQLETRSDPDRDPRGRILATAYLGLVAMALRPDLPADTAWHPVDELPPTAFDHGSVIDSARERLRAKLSYTTIALALAPPSFSISTLRGIYVAALGHDVSATNLQRVLLRRGALVATGQLDGPGPSGGRPGALYRFARHTVEVTDAFATFRPPG